MIMNLPLPCAVGNCSVRTPRSAPLTGEIAVWYITTITQSMPWSARARTNSAPSQRFWAPPEYPWT